MADPTLGYIRSVEDEEWEPPPPNIKTWPEHVNHPLGKEHKEWRLKGEFVDSWGHVEPHLPSRSYNGLEHVHYDRLNDNRLPRGPRKEWLNSLLGPARESWSQKTQAMTVKDARDNLTKALSRRRVLSACEPLPWPHLTDHPGPARADSDPAVEALGSKVTLEEAMRRRNTGQKNRLRMPIGHKNSYCMAPRTGPSEPYQGGAKPLWKDPRFPDPREWLLPRRVSYPDRREYEAELQAKEEQRKRLKADFAVHQGEARCF